MQGSHSRLLDMPLRKRDSSGFGPDVQWNTARCHRLIRPLVSSIHALEIARDAERNIYDPTSSIHTIPTSFIKEEARRSKCSDNEDETDRDWGVPQPRKRLKRTYSERCRSRDIDPRPAQQAECSVFKTKPGEITIPTPFLRRTRCRTATNYIHDEMRSTSLVTDGRNSNLSSINLQQGSQPSFAPFSRVLDAFERILVATNISNQYLDVRPHPLGPASLFSLCLQKIPTLMAEEEEVCKELRPDDAIDVSAEIYAELENLEHIPGRGWKHLAAVVRAHGVTLLQKAISEIPLNWSCISGLLNLCRKHDASTEAEKIFGAFCSSRTWTTSIAGSKLAMELSWRNAVLQLDLSTSSVAHRESGDTDIESSSKTVTFAEPDAIATFVNKHNNPLYGSPALLQKLFENLDHIYGARFRHFTDLVTIGRLPVATLTERNFRPLWNHIIRSIADLNDDAVGAAHFVERVIISGCGLSTFASDGVVMTPSGSVSNQRLEAIENTVFSLLTILSSIAITSQDVLQERQLANYISDESRPLHTVSAMIRHATRSTKRMCPRSSLGNVLLRMAVVATDLVTILMTSNLYNEGLVLSLESRLEVLFILNKQYLSGNNPECTAIGSLSDLMCSIARCVAKAYETSTFEVLHDLVWRLLEFQQSQTSIHGSISSTNFETSQRAALISRQLALGTAMSFAQQSPGPTHVAFAQEVELSIGRTSAVATLPTPSKTPRRAVAPKNRFRWEEGICEWVTATPASAAMTESRPRGGVPKIESPQHRLYHPRSNDNCKGRRQCVDVLKSIGVDNSNNDFSRSNPLPPAVAPNVHQAEEKENLNVVADLISPGKLAKVQAGPSIPIHEGVIAASKFRVACAYNEEDQDELSMHESSSHSRGLQQLTRPAQMPVVVIPVPSTSVGCRTGLQHCARDDKARVTRNAVARGWVVL